MLSLRTLCLALDPEDLFCFKFYSFMFTLSQWLILSFFLSVKFKVHVYMYVFSFCLLILNWSYFLLWKLSLLLPFCTFVKNHLRVFVAVTFWILYFVSFICIYPSINTTLPLLLQLYSNPNIEKVIPAILRFFPQDLYLST